MITKNKSVNFSYCDLPILKVSSKSKEQFKSYLVTNRQAICKDWQRGPHYVRSNASLFFCQKFHLIKSDEFYLNSTISGNRSVFYASRLVAKWFSKKINHTANQLAKRISKKITRTVNQLAKWFSKKIVHTAKQLAKWFYKKISYTAKQHIVLF